MTTVEPMTDEEPAAGSTPAPVGTAWTRWRANWALGLMLIVTALTGPVGYAGQLGYAALIGLAGIASLPGLGVRRAPMPEFGILLLLVIWCAVAMSWTVFDPGHDFHHYKQIEGLTAVKLIMELGLYGAFVFLMRELPDRWAGRIMATLAVSLIVMTVAMAIDALAGQTLYRGLRLAAHASNQPEIIKRNAARGCYTLALFFWPAAFWMKRAGWYVPLIGMVVGGVIAAIGLNVDAPIAAVLLGGVAMVLVRRFGARAVWALLLATVVYFALAPTAVELIAPHLPQMHNTEGLAKESWSARVHIWRFAAERINERPWLGWGMDASRVWPDNIPLHPHNAALQVWLELGLVGAAIAALFWTWLWGRMGAIAERSRTSAAMGAAVAAAYLTIGGLSFGVWQEWWLALGALGVVVCQVFGQAFKDWIEPATADELIPLH